jgi:hypothetical protein
MRARIIFRGLILFEFEKPRSNGEGQQRGTLTAWLISQPEGMASPMAEMHTHRPRIGVIGRDATTRREFIVNSLPIPSGETRIQLIGHSVDSGVVPTKGFDEHVPRLALLHGGAREGKSTLEGCSRIVIPHGQIRPRDFVSWDSDGNPASAVAFMGTTFQGFVANEAVVDVGDDTIEGGDETHCLTVDSKEWRFPNLLSPLSVGDDFQDETDPNTVEILITNFAPQRRRAVFWSLHYEWLFDVLGYGRTDYTRTQQFSDFESVAKSYDSAQWEDDRAAMSVGQPFPYIITDDIRPPEAFSKGTKTKNIHTPPPPPAGRGKEIRHTPMPMQMIGESPMGAGTDPWARPICPLGQLD